MSDAAVRHTALRTGVRLEAITVGWIAVEAGLAIGAGVSAKSVLLNAFDADSLIELSAALRCYGACASKFVAATMPGVVVPHHR
jgi:hypothetical protein